MSIGFGDTVALPSSDSGIVRFIGYTEFKKNVIFYGVHLKEPIGKNNGSYNNRKYFKCSKKHGIFTEKKNLKMVKKHNISTPYRFNQSVTIECIENKGVLKYIGLTEYDSYNNYCYGVLLEQAITAKHMDAITKNPMIYYNVAHKNVYVINENISQIIFVRQNQLKSVKKTKAKKRKKNTKSKTMVPQKKIRKSKTMMPIKKKKKKTVKNTPKSPKTPKANMSKQNSKTVKFDKNIPKKKGSKKKKNIRKNRVKSDLGQIRKKNAKKLKKRKVKKTKKPKIKILKSLVAYDDKGCPTPSTKESKHKKRKFKKRKQTMPENTEMKTEILSYKQVINNSEYYERYIDSKHYFYHRQFRRNNAGDLSEIKERICAPSLVEHFSSQSRIHQRKKRMIPERPKIYEIEIKERPLGFFIETKQLNTIIERSDGEIESKQIEIVDGANMFNKVNAYISMISSVDLWKDSPLVIGSQLLSINGVEMRGLAFTKIFKILSSHDLPFTLALAAPIYEEGSDVETPTSPTFMSPKFGAKDFSGFNRVGKYRGRGQTIDETKFHSKKRFLIF